MYKPIALPGMLLDPTNPINSGLVGWWPLNDNGGIQANDFSGKANAGVLTNGPTWVSGNIGQALNFDGVNDSVIIPSSSSVGPTGDITITAWINVTDFSGYRGILGKTDATNTSNPAPYDYYLITATGLPTLYRGDGSATPLHYGSFTGSTAPATGKWQFIAVTMAGNTITHYLNGATNGSGTMSNVGSFTITNGTGAARIGSRNDSVTLMKGRMDDIRLYNRALSRTEITTLYTQPGIGLYTPNAGKYFVASGAYSISAGVGSFALTGTTTGLKASRQMSAGAGSFTLTGNDTGLKAGRKMTAGTGAFNLTGIDVSLKAARKILADVGAFNLTGNNVTLTYTPGGGGPTYTITAGIGAFTLTGNDTALKAGRKISGETGAFNLTGNNATLTYSSGATFNKNAQLLIDSIGGMVIQLGNTTINSWNTAGRPTSPKTGTIGLNTQTVALDVWTGSAWKSVTLS